MVLLEPLSVPPEFVKEGADWLAVFNPEVPRVMDVKLEHTFVHEKVVCSARLSSDATLLAVGSDSTVYVYNLVAGSNTAFPLTPIDNKPRSCNYARAILFDHNAKHLFAGSEDKLIRIWNLETNTLVHILPGHRREVYALAFSPDGKTLASASGDRTIRLWDTPTILPSSADDTPIPVPTYRELLPPASKDTSKLAFTSVAVTEISGRIYVAAGSLDGAVRVWNATPRAECAGEVVAVLNGHEDSVYGVRFVGGEGSALGIVSASLDRTVKKWVVDLSGEKEESACEKTMKGHKDAVLAVSTIREGQNYRAASGSRDGCVRLWDLKSGAPMFVIRGHKNTVTCVDLSTEGKLLVSGSGDREVRVWRYTVI